MNSKIKALLISLSVVAPFVAAAATYDVSTDFIGGVYTYESANRGVLVNRFTQGDSEITITGRTISGNTLTCPASVTGGVQGGYISAGNSAVVKITNSDFLNNSITLNSATNSIYDGIIKASNLVVTGGEFSGNTAAVNNTGTSGTVYGIISSIQSGDIASFDNVTFDSNRATSTYRVQGGLFQVFNSSTLTINNSQITNNSAYAANKARGAAVENYNGTFNAQNTAFQGNHVESSTSSDSYGGALFSSNASAVSHLTDVTFTGNYAKNGYGGAVSLTEGATANFNVTKNTVFSGNYAADASGVKSDARGGFLWVDAVKSYANFNVATGATLTIGDGTAGYDSIASLDNAAVITKAEAGVLIVKSSMADYKGSLVVSEGEMRVLNSLGAANVSVSADASLVLLSGGFTSNGNVTLVADSSLTFILGADFSESSKNAFYLLEGMVSLTGFEDINDAVSVKNSDDSDYAGGWVVSLDSNGVLFTPVPEPSTYGIIAGVGLLGLFAIRRRRK